MHDYPTDSARANGSPPPPPLPPSPPSPPRVAVLMPVYNAGAYLGEAIESILNQNFTDLELIAVDDGSTDQSLAILRRYQQQDQRLKIISRANTGICGALNDALAQVSSPFIARMDADDTCHHHRLGLQLAYLESHPDCIAVGAWLTRTDPTGSPAGQQHPPTDHARIDAGLMQGRADVLVHATMMARTNVLRRLGGWRRQYDWVEDLDLLLRLAEQGELANLPADLYRYRRHEHSVCQRHYELMCRRISDVLREAYRRRGRTDEPNLAAMRPELGPRETSADRYRSWACHAIHQHNAVLARRHALAAMRRDPLSPRSWKVMYWALSA